MVRAPTSSTTSAATTSTAAYVIKNSNDNRSWNIAASVAKPMSHGVSLSGGYSYGSSKSLVEPSSTAGSSWGSANPITFNPNNPGTRPIGQLGGQSRVPDGHLYASVLQLRRDDGLDVLFGEPEHQQLLDRQQLRVLWRRERRRSQRQRPDLHPEGHVGDELQASHRERQDVHSRRSGRRVRTVHPERRLPSVAPRAVRRAERRSTARSSTAST